MEVAAESPGWSRPVAPRRPTGTVEGPLPEVAHVFWLVVTVAALCGVRVLWSSPSRAAVRAAIGAVLLAVPLLLLMRWVASAV